MTIYHVNYAKMDGGLNASLFSTQTKQADAIKLKDDFIAEEVATLEEEEIIVDEETDKEELAIIRSMKDWF